MIIWLNGAFGSGKTTLAHGLRDALPGSLVVDPELIGSLLGAIVPPSPTGDYQDLPMWRSLTIYALRELRRLYEVPLIVPMTLVRPSYFDEIMTGLQGEQVVHVFLDLDADELRRRIEAQVMHDDPTTDARIRQWRLDQVERCLAAVPTLPAEVHVLDSGRHDPAALVAATMRLIEH